MMPGRGKTETMASTKAISVKLGAQQASLLRHLESGHYDDASEVVRDALRALDQRDALVDEVLREEVRASMADKRPSVPIDEVFKRARARIARKAKAAARGA
jgi:antitoxin ParD1/3/4